MDKPVSHPFRVGEIYANRVGEYEVIDISPPKMTIRYHSNNQILVTDIALSARIWENLHLPPEVHPLGIAAIGYPAETPPPADRFDPARIHWNGWQEEK